MPAKARLRHAPGLLSLVPNSFDTLSNLMCRIEIERRRALLVLTTLLNQA